MKCVEHPHNDSIGKCSDCGKEICSVCLTATTDKIKATQDPAFSWGTALADKLYCPSCIDKLINKNTLAKETPLTSSDEELLQPFPESLKRWNWGAFLLTWIWGVSNGVYYSLWAFLPIFNIFVAFQLGTNGNQWAWENGKCKDIELFKKNQRKWAYAGVAGVMVMLLIGYLGRNM